MPPGIVLGQFMKTTTKNYRNDRLYPAVVRSVAELLKETDEISPVEILLHQQRLTKEQVEDWRFGRIPYLERVVKGNLSKINRILRILRFHAHDLNLVPVPRTYRKWGRGGKRIILRFSKTREKKRRRGMVAALRNAQQAEERISEVTERFGGNRLALPQQVPYTRSCLKCCCASAFLG